MKILMGIIMSVTFLNCAKATNYYLSAKLGNDDRTAAQAQNPFTPWKTLGKLNNYFSSLRPGDSVLLKRGEAYYGSLNVGSSGTLSSPIVISAYGSGAKPVITSFVTLSGWTPNETFKGVFESEVNAATVKTVNMVLLNGEAQQLGRFPNLDAPDKGYLNIESHSGTTSITDNKLSSAVDWTGAELVLRSRRWVLDRDLITSHSGSTIFYSATSKYEPTNKYGYFIQNDLKTLDQPGEWYYDPQSQKLSMFLGKNMRSSLTIQASTINNLISSTGFSNLVFDNLTISGANSCGFNIKNGSNININSCDILFSGVDGVRINNNKNISITNCTIANSNNNGINLGFNGSNYAVIRNNKIINTSAIAGMGGSGDGKGIAIQSNGKGTVIEFNEIVNTGYTAINFNGDSTIIKNNFIDSFCTIKDDGSAIYTYVGSKDGRVNKGRIVADNIVMNGIGALAGTNSKEPAANGIYMDVGATGVEITGNTVANTTAGIFFHKAHHLIAKDNILYGNSIGLFIQNNGGTTPISDNIITNNIFFPNGSNDLSLSIEANDGEMDKIGVLDSNFYWGVNQSDQKFKQRLKDNNSGKNLTRYLSLEDWRSTNAYDPSSKKISIPLSSNIQRHNFVRFEYNPTKKDKKVALNGNYIDAKGNYYSNKVVLKPYSSIILLKQTGKKFK